MNQNNIIKLSDVDSTNNYVLSLKESSVFNEGLVVVADFQTEGCGQRGNEWESEKGKNIILSFLLEPNISIQKQFDISKIASLAILDCLLIFGVKSKIKWPNDILVNNHKIAGILIQNVISHNIITHSIIGIGLNINQVIFDNYNPKATSLKLELNKDCFLSEIQAYLLNSIYSRIQDYRQEIDLSSDYLHALFQKDKVSVFESKFKKFKGVIRGVTDQGLLIIEIENKVEEFDLKEVKMLF